MAACGTLLSTSEDDAPAGIDARTGDGTAVDALADGGGPGLDGADANDPDAERVDAAAGCTGAPKFCERFDDALTLPASMTPTGGLLTVDYMATVQALADAPSPPNALHVTWPDQSPKGGGLQTVGTFTGAPLLVRASVKVVGMPRMAFLELQSANASFRLSSNAGKFYHQENGGTLGLVNIINLTGWHVWTFQLESLVSGRTSIGIFVDGAKRAIVTLTGDLFTKVSVWVGVQGIVDTDKASGSEEAYFDDVRVD